MFFFNQRRTLKQTSYVIINLALADLSVGLSGGCFAVENLVSRYTGKKPTEIGCLTVDVFSESASLTFLVLVSLERMHAVFWPFRHRMTEPRSYIYAICIVWLFSGVVTVIFILSYIGIVSQKIAIGIFVLLMAVFPISVCVVYLGIWLRMRHTRKQNVRKHRFTANKKLTETLLIACILSVVAWLPISSTLLINGLCASCLSLMNATRVVYGTRILQYGNSLLNPIVYSLRIPEFKDKLLELLCWHRCRRPKRSAPHIPGTACEVNALKSTTPVLLSLTSLNSPACRTRDSNLNSGQNPEV